MKWRYTVAAALVFAALLAWVLTQEQSRVAEEGEAFGLDATTATRLEVKRTGEEDLVVQKRDDEWDLVSPIQGLADGEQVMRMVKAIAELVPNSSREGVDLATADFGLVEPDTVAILQCGAKTVQISLGSDTPIGASRYAKIEGRDKLYIVPAALRTTLAKAADELREKKLANFETDDVRAIAVQTTEGRVAATRVGEGDKPRWELTEPLSTLGDEWNIKQLINKIKDMKAESFLTEDASDEQLGLAKPQVSVALTMTDGRELTVSVGKQSTRVIGTGTTEAEVLFIRSSERTEILIVKADVLEALTKGEFDLRDKSVVQISRDDIQRVKVERKKGLNFSVGRRPDGWIVEKPTVADASRSKIDNLLWDVEDLSAKSYVTEDASEADLRSYGLLVPSTALTITTGAGEPVKIYIGDATENGDYYCMTSLSKQVVTISKFLVDDLPETEEDLKASASDMTPEAPFPMDGQMPEMPQY